MKDVSDVAKALADLPPDSLVMMVVLAALALAAFCVHAIHSIAKDKSRQ